jgi:beta-glucosidase/6-phospho-beta-glucosidase/beta-galactosidase
MDFLFATGIENSYPVIEGDRRIDQMEKCGHYARWEDDFNLVRDLGLQALRYGPPYYRTHAAPDRYDWDSADAPMQRLRDLGIIVIADLCHFGVPSWIGSFQDRRFPELFAAYARAFARRYPWVRWYTPINEIFVCACFSALYGWWNERLSSDAAFVRAVVNLSRAHELAVLAILAERPDAIFLQSESIERFHPAGRGAAGMADRRNAQMLLALDLTLGRALPDEMARYLRDHGVSSDEIAFFRADRAPGQRLLGLDYYATCEHRIAASGRCTTSRKKPEGLARVAAAYYERYKIPLFHSETHHISRFAVGWLAEQWREILALRGAGIPVHGFTWYSLTDQMDWQHALRVERNDLHPVGLFDLKRRIRPVGVAYRELIARSRPSPSQGDPRERLLSIEPAVVGV